MEVDALIQAVQTGTGVEMLLLLHLAFQVKALATRVASLEAAHAAVRVPAAADEKGSTDA
jgi:hypothetical protein